MECFDRETNTCPIAQVCGLKGMLNEALNAFLSTLNAYTLADVLENSGRRKLANLFAAGKGVLPILQ